MKKPGYYTIRSASKAFVLHQWPLWKMLYGNSFGNEPLSPSNPAVSSKANSKALFADRVRNTIINNPDRLYKKIILAFLVLGILFRLYHYLDNRSFWIDETYLSSSIVRMDFWDLATPPLDYEQKAPIGFLWSVKLCILLFGTTEMAIRLFPLLCGIATLFAFLPLCRYFLNPFGTTIAMGIMTFAPPIIYHAVEAKQYGAEALATILLLLSFIRYHQKESLRSLLMWGFIGAVIIWFSYTSIFILAAMGAAVSLRALHRKNWRTLFHYGIPFTLWLVSFAINFLLFTYKHAESEWLTVWFRDQRGFMPLHLSSIEDIKWFIAVPFKAMHYPLGLNWYFNVMHGPLKRYLFSMSIIPLALVPFGLLYFYRRSKMELLLLTLPILLALAASGLEKYPFYERLIVFLAPQMILLIAGGIMLVASLIRQKIVGYLILPALLLFGPVLNTVHQAVHTYHFAGANFFGVGKKQHMREAVMFINERYQPGDVVYAYWNFKHVYRMYKSMYPLKFTAIEGSDVRYAVNNKEDYYQKLEPELQALKGKKRVWLVYDRGMTAGIGEFVGEPAWYVKHYERIMPDMLIYQKFATMGKELEAYQQRDVHASLFDLSQP